MTESIFFYIMIASPRFAPSFFNNFAQAILDFKVPEGVRIKELYNASDRLTDHIHQEVNKKNSSDELCNPIIVDEDVSAFEVIFETEQSLIYQKLPWFEDQVLEFVRGYDISVALYLFYLIDNGNTFQSLNIAKVHTKEGVKVYEDPIEDDMTPLFDLASYLNCYWYQQSEEALMNQFPDQTALYYLLFG